MLTYADVCWRMLTYADVCWRKLTYADVCSLTFRARAIHRYGGSMLTYADVCWRMLTYADVSWRMLANFQSTCYTSLWRQYGSCRSFRYAQVWVFFIKKEKEETCVVRKYECMSKICVVKFVCVDSRCARATSVWGLKLLVYKASSY
jgi:hypothetical protein